MKKKILIIIALTIIIVPIIAFAVSNNPIFRVGNITFTGDGTVINLIAATTNALNGALLARRPDHYKNFTVVGIMLFAILGGIGGGVIRDIIINQVPSSLTNPAYILLCLAAGVVGYFVAYKNGQFFREGFFQFMTAFSLPWYAIIGAKMGLEAGLPILGCLFIAVIGATAGRYLIDLSCGVPPKQFVQGEWFVVTAIITAVVWMICNAINVYEPVAYIAAFGVGFSFRLLALFHAYEEPLAKEPSEAYLPDDGRPRLGRKLDKNSERELKAIGIDKDKDSEKKQ